MRIAKHNVAGSRRVTAYIDLTVLLLAAAIVPLRPAWAYVDPNSAGLLYQILFPVLVAIASMLTFLRRAVARLWRRVVSWFKPTPDEAGQDTEPLP
jgi:hypothetical protein